MKILSKQMTSTVPIKTKSEHAFYITTCQLITMRGAPALILLSGVIVSSPPPDPGYRSHPHSQVVHQEGHKGLDYMWKGRGEKENYPAMPMSMNNRSTSPHIGHSMNNRSTDHFKMMVSMNDDLATDAHAAGMLVREIGAPDATNEMNCVEKEMTYEESCHTSFVTAFVPHDEEECMKIFRKVILAISMM